MSQTKHQAPNITKQAAVQFTQQSFGITATAHPLPSERDQNFRLTAPDGREYVLKISNAAEKKTVLDLQNETMKRVAAYGNPTMCPHICPTLAGDEITHIQDSDGNLYYVRLLTYLPGKPLAKVNPHTPDLLQTLGHFLGSLDAALIGFEHSAAHRYLAWDLKHAPDIIDQHMNLIVSSEHQAIIANLLAYYKQKILPQLPKLRQSIIHNDGNDYNLIVSPDGSISVIDFGDMVYTYTISEVAIAAAYAMFDKADPLSAAAQIIRGYHDVYPLTEDELYVLFPMICMRICTSVAMAAYQYQQEPDNEYLLISQNATGPLLQKLADIHPRFAWYIFRQACSLTPCPQTETVTRWLHKNSHSTASPVEADLRNTPNIVFDLSVSSPLLAHLDNRADVGAFTNKLFSQMLANQVDIGIGRYNEARQIYASDLFAVAGDEIQENRTIHLGIDLFLAAGSPIFAPFDGYVHSFRNNAAHLDYGPTIILEHHIENDDITFYTLYGHLSEESLHGLKKGQPVKRGGLLAHIGAYPSNGYWPPHLHFQIITDMLGREGEFPGVAAASQRDIWLSLCPDPNLILGISSDSFPSEARSKAEILNIRAQKLGKSLSVSYTQPLKIVRGQGQYLYDETGQTYLDCVNNVCHVGHCHPRIVQAAQDQMAVLNTNTRYLHDNLTDYVERLTATLPDPLSVCFLVCSGSEANELALRLAKTHTGGTDMIVVDGAYHGNTSAMIDISPYKHDGRGGSGTPPYVHKVLMPDPYRGPYNVEDPDIAAKYADHVLDAVNTAKSQNQPLAAFICESILSCGGQIVLPDGYLKAAYAHVRAAGGICIADEVQVGFGRVGTHFWGFETQGVVPDIVTIGKPIGNGHPMAAVVTTPEIAASFANGMEYFNTFGGNPVSCAIGLAVLDVIEDEALQRHAQTVGNYLMSGLRDLMQKSPLIGDVRGLGLFVGIEFVLDQDSLEPAPQQASYIVERMKSHGILLSTDGPLHNVIKIKPPLVFTQDNADFLIKTLKRVLREDPLHR